MSFQYPMDVLFKHCDPAGIVFYPRYFEMMNDVVEVFFRDALGYPFHEMVPEFGVPTVAIQTEFHAPSRHGEALLIDLTVKKLGRTSVNLLLQATCKGQLRFSTDLTLVHVDAAGKPSQWPDDTRDKLSSFEKDKTNGE